MGRTGLGGTNKRGIAFMHVDFREGVPEEMTHKLRGQKDVDGIQMSMGRGEVGLDCSREKKACREAQYLGIP